MPLTFGRVPHPPFVDRLIPSALTRAWDDLGERRALGVCWHSMVGTLWGTDAYFRGGAPALTDYGIGGATDGPQWDGVILRWNDPLGRRSPWANGGSDDLEGDGPLFVRTLGVDAINRDLVSIERSDGGMIGTPLSAKQAESLCRLTAHFFDRAGVPWDRYPLHPAHGVVTHMLHLEFATKGCPHAPVTERIEELQRRVRGILRAAQTGDEGQPAPPPEPVRPDHAWWPQGYDLETLRRRFGLLTRHEPDGSTRAFHFDPKGVISNAWVARGVAEQRTAKQLPAASAWWVLPREPGPDDSRSGQQDIVTFAGGWTLFRPNPAVTWRWIA